MNRRIEKLKQILSEKGLDSFFISDQNNVCYLTGISGLKQDEREIFLFLCKAGNYLLTFPTLFDSVSNIRDLETMKITSEKRLTDHLNNLAVKSGAKGIAFEKDSVTYSEYESLRSKLSLELTPVSGITESLRTRKDTGEISAIKKAASLTDKGFERILMLLKPGVTEKIIADEIEIFFKKNGAETAFGPIAAFGANSAVPHHRPSNTKLEPNDIALFDFGAKIDGYCSDMTRTVFTGKPEEKMIKAYNDLLSAQNNCLDMIYPGTITGIADEYCKNLLASKGYPPYLHGLGHGVGLAVHEDPRLKAGNHIILEDGMTVTVEPGVYFPGEFGIRIEDLVALSNNGIEILSRTPKDLLILK